MTTRESQIIDLTQLVREVHSLMQQLMSHALSDFDITPQQYTVLAEVGRLGHVTNGDVCDILSLSKGTASGILKRLTERGYLVRDVSKDDRRHTSYHFTEEGKAFYHELEGTRATIADALFDGCTNADLAAWSRQLRRLSAVLKRKEADVSQGF